MKSYPVFGRNIALALASLALPHSAIGGQPLGKSCFDFAKTSASSDARTGSDVIGAATMEDDGTIVLMLRAESPGATGDAMLRYPVTHPRYAEICRHLGGIRVGESKHVRAFPSPEGR